jgi:hypothetical protein
VRLAAAVAGPGVHRERAPEQLIRLGVATEPGVRVRDTPVRERLGGQVTEPLGGAPRDPPHRLQVQRCLLRCFSRSRRRPTG